jgi:hypothetical protein
LDELIPSSYLAQGFFNRHLWIKDIAVGLWCLVLGSCLVFPHSVSFWNVLPYPKLFQDSKKPAISGAVYYHSWINPGHLEYPLPEQQQSPPRD